MQAPLILSVSLVLFIFVTSLPGPRDWLLAITSRKKNSFFIIFPLIIVFLGSTEGAQLNALWTDIPRMVRAFFTSLLFVLSITNILQNTNSWKFAGTGGRWIIYFFLYCTLSAAWSLNPIISGWKGFESVTLALSALSVAHTLKKEEDIKWLLNVISACLLFLALTVICGFILFPSEATIIPENAQYFAVRGLVPIMNPASIGSLAGLLLVCAFSSTVVSKGHKNVKSNFGFWLVACIAVTNMLLGHSRTPIFAALIAIMAILFFAKKSKQVLIVGVTGGLILTATSAIEFVLNYMYRGQTVEAFTSLTGRLNFWERDVFDLIASSPIIGSGYYAAFRSSFNVGSVDNSYLAVITGVGFLGLVIFLVPIIYAGLNILRSRIRKREITQRDSYWLTLLGMSGIIFIRSLTGTSIEVMHPLLIVHMVLQLGVAAIIRINNSKSASNEVINNIADNSTSTITEACILKKRPSSILHVKNNKK